MSDQNKKTVNRLLADFAKAAGYIGPTSHVKQLGDAIVAALDAREASVRAEERKSTVTLAALVVDESGGCDDCENVALWDRWDDPETRWEACDRHKGDFPEGWTERKALRAALAALANLRS